MSTDAERGGVAVRLAFNVGHEKPRPLFPPPTGSGFDSGPAGYEAPE